MVSPTALQKLLVIFSKQVDIVSAGFSNPDTNGENEYLPMLLSFQA